MSTPTPHARLEEEHWRTAFDIIQRAQHLPLDERRALAESVTTDQAVLDLVFEMWEEEAAEVAASDPDQSPVPGAHFGRYEILGKLGAGGMGQVYSARDLELGRPVALKFLTDELAGVPGAVDRLVREAKAASALNHPHIVTVYEVIRSGVQTAIAMELVEGVALRNHCGSAQPAAKVIHWGQQIAAGLAAAHRQGIVHRDIKPENVMVRADDYVKVVDFGVARQTTIGAHDASGSAGRPGGTVHYYSPEQVRGERATAASDVFSLGMVLYELATGHHPFRGGTGLETIHAIVHLNPLQPSTRNALVPKRLNRLILDMLAKRAEARPPAVEVAARLTAAGAPAGRRRWIGLLAAGLAAMGGAAAVWIWRTPPPSFVLRQLTTTDTENRVTAAAISPDGKQLAYADVTGEILIRSLETNTTLPLHGPAGLEIGKIAWFPDRSRLVVTGRSPSTGSSAAWIVPVNGSEPRLARDNIGSASPSPDGSRLALTTSDSREIWIAWLDTGQAPRRLLAGGDGETFPVLEWAEGGKRLICQRRKYAANDASSDLTPEPHHVRSYETIDAATGEVIFKQVGIAMRSAAALADGRVFFLWPGANVYSINIWEMKTDPATGRIETPPRLFTQYKEMALAGITASSDGRRIAMVHYQHQPDVYVGELDPTGRRLVSSRRLTLERMDDYPHSWSPDGQTVYFESNRNGSFDIFRQRLGQPHAEFIAGKADVAEFSPVLTPDGKWLLYAASDDGKPGERSLERVSPAGGVPVAVPIGGQLDYFDCALTGGKRCVLRSTEDREYVFYELDPVLGRGRELARVPWTPGLLGDWSLSAAGTEVAIPNHNLNERLIRTVPLDSPGTLGRVVRLGGKGMIGGVHYAADDAGWFVSLRHEAEYFRSSPLLRSDLVYADRHGAVTVLRETPIPTWAAVAPGGLRIAFPDGTITGNAVLLER